MVVFLAIYLVPAIVFTIVVMSNPDLADDPWFGPIPAFFVLLCGAMFIAGAGSILNIVRWHIFSATGEQRKKRAKDMLKTFSIFFVAFFMLILFLK